MPAHKRRVLRPPTEEEADALGQVRLFAALPHGVLDGLRALARVVTLSAGERLWRQGAPASSVGLILVGRCKKIREDSGREIIVDVVAPGALLGNVASALASEYTTTVVCLQRAKVLLLPSAQVREGLKSESRALAVLAADLASEVERLMGMVQSLSAGNVERRLASALLALSDRAGEPFPGGTLVPLRLRRADLAALSATTLESASRCISAWKRRGLVTPQPAGYLLHDLPRLRALASGAG